MTEKKQTLTFSHYFPQLFIFSAAILMFRDIDEGDEMFKTLRNSLPSDVTVEHPEVQSEDAFWTKRADTSLGKISLPPPPPLTLPSAHDSNTEDILLLKSVIFKFYLNASRCKCTRNVCIIGIMGMIIINCFDSCGVIIVFHMLLKNVDLSLLRPPLSFS